MHVSYKFGVYLIFILSLSKCYTRATPVKNQSSILYGEYDDGYDDDDYYEDTQSSTVPSSTLATIITSTTNRQIVTPKRSNRVLEPSCPMACICLENSKYVQCSNARLTEVPSDIPSTALILDLSQNQIKTLRDNQFANCSRVQEINLNGNQLTQVNPEAFNGLWRLQRLRLASNLLTAVEPNAFSGASDLSTLELSNNSIQLRKEDSFLNQPSLLELSCRNCSWTQVYDQTFANLSSLTALKLDQNNFGKKINTQAFRPLRNLIKLKLPELDQNAVQELCNLLKSIDNISFKHFDVSCFELVLGATYDESVILATDPPYKPPVDSNAAAPAVSSPKSKSTLATTSIGVPPKRKAVMTAAVTNNLTLSEPNHNLTNLILPATDIDSPVGVLVTVSPPLETEALEKPYQVPISQEAINIMLIAIMLIAIVGIIIGLICRKDIGGIKTKCCRTRKPEAKDQVHPAEEIPLNKLA